jgi:SPP1 family predicted phage head-tail adaptor
MPDPGALRDRITIEREVSTDMGGGGSEVGWSQLAQVWAQILPARGGEQLQAAALGATTLYYITIRWRSDVTEQQRIRLASGDLLNIRNSVDPDGGQREWLRITAEKGVAT